jgi:hypothetical protein
MMDEIVPLMQNIFGELNQLQESIVELDESVFVFVSLTEQTTLPTLIDKSIRYE